MALAVGVLAFEDEKNKFAAALSSELDAFLNSYSKNVFQDELSDHAFPQD